jgi:hypothetical protein
MTRCCCFYSKIGSAGNDVFPIVRHGRQTKMVLAGVGVGTLVGRVREAKLVNCTF